MTASPSQIPLLDPLISFDAISQDELNECLVSWGHKMGPLNRPTPSCAHGLRHDGRLVAVTATDHLMAESCGGLTRAEALELSRVCAERADLCRIALRLWREFVFPGYCRSRSVEWAISYQDAAQHTGGLYRFDGWVRLGFSHSGRDSRSGRHGRDKWIWGWHADPVERERRAVSGKPSVERLAA